MVLSSKLAGLWFSLLLSWDLPPSINCLLLKSPLFSPASLALNLPHSVANKVNFFKDSTKALCSYRLPLSLGKIPNSLFWSWDQDSDLLLLEWHTCFSSGDNSLWSLKLASPQIKILSYKGSGARAIGALEFLICQSWGRLSILWV